MWLLIWLFGIWIMNCYSDISTWTRSFIFHQSNNYKIEPVRVRAQHTTRYVETRTPWTVFISELLLFDWGQYGNNYCNRMYFWLYGLISSLASKVPCVHRLRVLHHRDDIIWRRWLQRVHILCLQMLPEQTLHFAIRVFSLIMDVAFLTFTL